MFYEAWQEFDPEGTQYMPFENLEEFLDVLEPPLQIPKPNKFKVKQGTVIFSRTVKNRINTGLHNMVNINNAKETVGN